jgi:predicted nucleic acid-binding protein
MICVDTTVLIDEFRARGNPEATVNRTLLAHGAELLIVSVIAAGEFLDGASMVSEKRLRESMDWLSRRRIVAADVESAHHYGRIVAELRRSRQLSGRSQNDMWIAAIAMRHGATLMTRNSADFTEIDGLRVVAYGE